MPLLLQYILCLLFGYPSTNNASLNSDPFFKLYHRKCLEIHRRLESTGMMVRSRLKRFLACICEKQWHDYRKHGHAVH